MQINVLQIDLSYINIEKNKKQYNVVFDKL